MEEDDLLTPKSKRAQRLENLHLKSKSELISSPFLDEETIIKSKKFISFQIEHFKILSKWFEITINAYQ